MHYISYLNRRYNRPTLKEPLHTQIRWKHAAQVPGFIGDPNGKNRVFDIRFKKWGKLPDAAHKLYWRHHKTPNYYKGWKFPSAK